MKSLSAEKLNICFIFEKYKNFPIAKLMKEFHILVAIELFMNLFMNLIFALEPFLFLKRFSTSHFHLVLSFLNLKSSQYNFPALCKENFKMHLSREQTFITSVALVVTFLDFSMNRLLSKKKTFPTHHLPPPPASPSASSPSCSLGSSCRWSGPRLWPTSHFYVGAQIGEDKEAGPPPSPGRSQLLGNHSKAFIHY